MSENLRSILNREREEQRRLAQDWQQAVDKLSIMFWAGHGGGYPDCLKDRTPQERLRILRGMGFKVKERFEVDISAPGGPPDYEQWVRITKYISVSLSAGFVCKSGG